MKIKRFDMPSDQEVWEAHDGEYVRFADHKDVVDRLQKKIAQLAEERNRAIDRLAAAFD